MQNLKRIVCLANSRKLRGRCVAGREWNDGQAGPWIRPVSDREHEEVSEYERQYEDGSDPRVLDVIDIPMVGPRPRGCQAENWLIDPECYWEKVGRMSWSDLPKFVDPPSPLWLDGYSTYNGQNDRIPEEIADSVEGSLKLVHVDNLQIWVFKPTEAFGNTKRRVQGRFNHEGIEYGLWITDPTYERQYLAKLDGTYSVGECFLTVSLAEPYSGAVYKLIASVIEEQRR